MQYVEAILRPFFHRDGGNIEVIKATCLALGTPFFTNLIFPVDGGALGSEFHSRKILDSLRITLRTERDSLRWVLTARFSVFKKQLRSNPMLDAVDLALLLFGSHKTAMAICTGRNFGLQAALGRDTVIDITGWINTYHPHCVKNPAVHISVEDLLGAFSKRLTYYRKASSTSDYDRYGAGASTSKERDSPVPYIDEEEGDL
ncbi:hypothetical protein RvY_16220 [Ramazzottius varieornatus]|uniref:Uncharacterized protein n=1 Tax=Ramazzottius varieornatus TaxID=947166 RepID=A0A1D1W480_RAMVA|nr:hypothetical protein RvY_16220 [Ramazzottius varieornatus]